MGIRVNKRLGYGLKDLQTKRKKGGAIPQDPRWDYDLYQALGSRKDTIEGYRDWVTCHKERIEFLHTQEYGTDPFGEQWILKANLDALVEKPSRQLHDWTARYDGCVWGDEYHLRNVLSLVPPEHHKEWVRSNNIIDYYEEQTRNGPRRYAKFLNEVSGIEPYAGMVRRFREPTPEVRAMLSEASRFMLCFVKQPSCQNLTDGADVRHMAEGDYNILIGRWSKTQDPIIKEPAILKHFVEDWRPTIPLCVLSLIDYMGCFPDAYGLNGIVNSLRPMIYVYWC